MMMMS